MSSSHQKLGRWGEQRAGEYLTSLGYSILANNVRTPYGEIDLIACHGSLPGNLGEDQTPLIVFVEVKTRSSKAFGAPEVAITPQKQAHMLDLARAYLQAHPEIEGDWRIDVIAIQGSRSTLDPQIVHFENVITIP